MRGLFYKDLICARVLQYTLAILGTLLIPVIVLPLILEKDLAGEIVFLYLAAYIPTLYGNTVMYVRSVMETDRSTRVEAYMRSLPVGHKTYVAAKYILALGIFLALMIIFMLTFLLETPFFTGIGLTGIGQLVGYFPAVTGLFLTLEAVELPFYVRFGAVAGERIRITVLVMALFAVLIWLMFGDLTVFKQFRLEALGEWLETGTGWSNWCRIGIPAASLMLYGLSGMLSVRLYPKKEMGE
ncbi:MAG: ABC-2 transporter permease [Lachnospiraceae bacterium]|nr:ABC-2 transporter permease [Lachnospiraceae bacterium]